VDRVASERAGAQPAVQLRCRFHERGFAAPASRFRNFTPNAISQAATFVGVCEGFLGIPVIWDLWVHLFCAELHTLMTPKPKIRHAVRAGGMTIALRNTRTELYIPCTMTSNNSGWERGGSTSATTAPTSPPTPASS
jgi:hypothetical protein